MFRTIFCSALLTVITATTAHAFQKHPAGTLSTSDKKSFRYQGVAAKKTPSLNSAHQNQHLRIDDPFRHQTTVNQLPQQLSKQTLLRELNRVDLIDLKQRMPQYNTADMMNYLRGLREPAKTTKRNTRVSWHDDYQKIKKQRERARQALANEIRAARRENRAIDVLKLHQQKRAQ